MTVSEDLGPPNSGTQRVRQYVIGLKAGGFWDWIIDQLDDHEVDTIYQTYLSDENAPLSALASALYMAKLEEGAS